MKCVMLRKCEYIFLTSQNLIEIDTGPSTHLFLQATADGKHSLSWSSLKLLVLFFLCSSIFVAAPEGRAEEGLQLSDNTDWITLHPMRVQVWVSYYWQASAEPWSSWREEVRHCCLLCAAIIGPNVAAVRQNTQHYNSAKESKVSILTFSWQGGWMGGARLSSDWQLNQLWNYNAISPFVHVALHKPGSYRITN